jgi:hypothetical protein
MQNSSEEEPSKYRPQKKESLAEDMLNCHYPGAHIAVVGNCAVEGRMVGRGRII